MHSLQPTHDSQILIVMINIKPIIIIIIMKKLNCLNATIIQLIIKFEMHESKQNEQTNNKNDFI